MLVLVIDHVRLRKQEDRRLSFWKFSIIAPKKNDSRRSFLKFSITARAKTITALKNNKTDKSRETTVSACFSMA